MALWETLKCSWRRVTVCEKGRCYWGKEKTQGWMIGKKRYFMDNLWRRQKDIETKKDEKSCGDRGWEKKRRLACTTQEKKLA